MAKLSDLRTLLDAARQRQRAVLPRHPSAMKPAALARTAGPRALAATKHADGDIDFAQAFADVTRLPPANKAGVARVRPSALPQQTLADERAALAASQYGNEPAPHSWEIGQEMDGEQTFVRRGLGSDVLRGLRRGRWVVQTELDLHGMTSHEAHDALVDFLLDARARGQRCARVIHGKGLTSPNREPVLKSKVRRWLAHFDDVLAYCEAPRHAGGSGAVVILLRGK